jgi:hypothetical protein
MMSAAIWSRPDLAGVALALADVVTAVATGQLTPEEGQAVAAMLEVQRRGIELADHERRLKALEARTREVERWATGPGSVLERRLAPANAMPTLIRITGSLPDAAPVRATVDYHELEREPDETLRTFEARVLAAARTVGRQIVVIGGLRDQ